MSQDFRAGDFLIFQIESGFGLLRLLAIDELGSEKIWHLAAYEEMCLDVDSADRAIENSSALHVSYPHLALTNRAFESTQVARMSNQPLPETILNSLDKWRENPDRKVSDLSVRLLLGLR